MVDTKLTVGSSGGQFSSQSRAEGPVTGIGFDASAGKAGAQLAQHDVLLMARDQELMDDARVGRDDFKSDAADGEGAFPLRRQEARKRCQERLD
jgi:hypothetical protein